MAKELRQLMGTFRHTVRQHSRLLLHRSLGDRNYCRFAKGYCKSKREFTKLLAAAKLSARTHNRLNELDGRLSVRGFSIRAMLQHIMYTELLRAMAKDVWFDQFALVGGQSLFRQGSENASTRVSGDIDLFREHRIPYTEIKPKLQSVLEAGTVGLRRVLDTENVSIEILDEINGTFNDFVRIQLTLERLSVPGEIQLSYNPVFHDKHLSLIGHRDLNNDRIIIRTIPSYEGVVQRLLGLVGAQERIETNGTISAQCCSYVFDSVECYESSDAVWRKEMKDMFKIMSKGKVERPCKISSQLRAHIIQEWYFKLFGTLPNVGSPIDYLQRYDRLLSEWDDI